MGVFRRTKRPSSRKISSQSRYDHFDTAPYLSQHQHLGKRGELMGRTSKNIKLRTPEKPRKIKGFRSGSYRVATTISSAARYNHFDTSLFIRQIYYTQKKRYVNLNFDIPLPNYENFFDFTNAIYAFQSARPRKCMPSRR